MNLIDMHCDTVWKLKDLDKAGDFMENRGSIHIPAMRAGGTLAQFFACFIWAENMPGRNMEEKYEAGYTHVLEMIHFLKEQVDTYRADMALAGSVKDIEANKREDRISAIVTVEEGGILNGKIERLEELYRQGVRSLTLLWNHENCIGYPNSKERTVMERGLTPFGYEVTERMNELGMILDLSHASDGVFADVLRHSRKPVIASHSNCRALSSHPRNLSDEMIRALAEKGGIAGLNFYGPFLGTPDASRVEEMCAHILHMIDKGGSGFPAIGTDFDGFDGVDTLEIPDAGHMGLLMEALKKRGLTTGQIEKVWSGNVLRVMRGNLTACID